jgi:nicotinate-nucleotide adenylyltransferase
MVSLAVASDAAFVASDVELSVPGRSFTAETLRRLHRSGIAPSQLFFIIGTDAFAEIATWHDYPAVLDLAHFVVISRARDPLSRLASLLPALAGRMTTVREPRDVPDRGQTAILLVDADTPAVSATEIRTRLHEGHSIDGLTPPAVADHIRRHGLYPAARHGNGDGAQAGRQIA